MANVFLDQLAPKEKAIPEFSNESGKENVFLNQIKDMPAKKEGLGKSLARSAIQIPLGAAQRFTYPANLLQLGGVGEALAEYDELLERLPDLKKKFPNAPWENFEGLSKEKYEEGIEAASKSFPTQQNLEALIEEKTGAPLTPKNEFQKALRLSGTGGALKKGNLADKATAGAIAGGGRQALIGLGVPEAIAEPLALGASGLAKGPQVSKVTKPSGMTARRFENIKKETKVSPERHEAISKSVENDFRGIADKILEKNRTYSALKDDALFKEKISNLFEDVQDLAKDIKGNIHTDDLRNAFRKRYNTREQKGISPDEFERSFSKEIRAINKSIPASELEPIQLVEQFRKNNRSLKELFEPGKSSAQNRAKREALLEYNRSIEDVINKKYPDTEFGDLFKFTNKRWQEISDIEQIDKFTNDLFDKKINYEKAKKIFNNDKDYIARPFKRILGEEGFKDFKGLLNDLMTTEKAMGLIKKAEAAGFKDIARHALLYMASPTAAKASLLASHGKQIWQLLLDKPQLTITWKSGIDNMKSGNYKAAEKDFSKLDKEFGNNE